MDPYVIVMMVLALVLAFYAGYSHGKDARQKDIAKYVEDPHYFTPTDKGKQFVKDGYIIPKKKKT